MKWPVPSVCLSVCLFILLSVWFSGYQSVCNVPPTKSTNLFICLSVTFHLLNTNFNNHLSFCQLACSSICLSVHPPVYLSICLSFYVSLPVWLWHSPNEITYSTCLSICLFNSLFLGLPVCLSICLSLSIHLSVSWTVCSSVYLSVHLSVYPTVCPSVCTILPMRWLVPPVCPSICLCVHLSVC